MGIVNVTPDSFSDGGQFLNADHAVQHALQLEAEGAAILDIGGESTRPGAQPVDAEEELRRVVPVIEKLSQVASVPLSIDTSKAMVAQAAIDAGAQIVNDVSALGDTDMLRVVTETGVGICVMHQQGTPSTMQANPTYADVVLEVKTYLAERRDMLLQHGVAAERICLDPGIGFGKTTEHNLAIFRGVEELHELGCPLLVGHSRKRFLGELIGDPDADRLAATIGSTLVLAAKQVQIIRVHDVRAVQEALKAFISCGGIA